MSKALKILMLSSEAVPFAKAGGLADVVPVLSRFLSEKGHDVRIILPRYYFIDPKNLELLNIKVAVEFPQERIEAKVYTALVPETQVKVYFLDYEPLYGRDGIYTGPGGKDYPDNALRFAFLNRALFGLCEALNWFPDILHAHDWPSAPALAMLDSYKAPNSFARCAGVFSIHNVGYQGLFDVQNFPLLGLPWDEFRMGSFEFWGRVNFMQGGLRHAQKITTVSPSYAKEICTPQFGFGMEGILSEKKDDLEGIINGMDYSPWDPSTDTYLEKNYDRKSLKDKVKNKLALQKELGLEVNKDIPLFGIISRLVSQKGFVELASPGFGSLPKILKDFPLQMVVLGSGEAWCEEEFKRLASIYPKLKVIIGYNEALSHKIQAASDFFLMPSLYEPCGLTQMYALRYGTIPIATKTGGLADTIKDYLAYPDEGTGILIPLPLEAEAIYKAVWKALDLWLDRPELLQEMKMRAMALRFTWDDSACKYEALYYAALKKKGI